MVMFLVNSKELFSGGVGVWGGVVVVLFSWLALVSPLLTIFDIAPAYKHFIY